jgi:hypothetical protein
MFDKSSYFKAIQHAACMAGEKESPDEALMAFKIDDADGIAKAIGFHPGMLNKVDYFLVHNHDVQLIELSDLEECKQNCHAAIEKALNELKIAQSPISKQQERDIVRSAWRDIKTEFVQKWSGSIAVIERLYRKSNELPDTDPKYKLLIVCKNHTDVEMLDVLKKQLSGMMGNVSICNTETLKSYLIKIES